MTQHPSGLILPPNTQAIIENVHYLVNNNLPVNKYVPLPKPRNFTNLCHKFSKQKSKNWKFQCSD